MISVIHGIEELSIWVGRSFGWCILILTLSVAYEVFVRYVLNAPTLWAFDMMVQMYGALFLMAGPRFEEDWDTLSEEVREPFNQAIERDMAALVEALLESRASPKQPRQIALSLMAMLQGIYLLSRTLDVPGEEGFAREQLERAALGMLEVST